MKTCPRCGSTLADDARFCASCGTSFEPVRQMNTNQQMMWQCRNCGALIPYNPQVRQVFCPTCGKPMNGDAADDKSWTSGQTIAVFSYIIAIVATFLPFFTYNILGTTASINLWYDTFMILTIIGVILITIGLIGACIKAKGMANDSIALGVLVLIDVFIQYGYNKDRLQNVQTQFGTFNLSGLLNPGVGFYLIVIAAVGMIVAGIVMKAEGKKR